MIHLPLFKIFLQTNYIFLYNILWDNFYEKIIFYSFSQIILVVNHHFSHDLPPLNCFDLDAFTGCAFTSNLVVSSFAPSHLDQTLAILRYLYGYDKYNDISAKDYDDDEYNALHL